MSICKICGATGAKFRGKKRLTLCEHCNSCIVDKVAQKKFDDDFWLDPSQVDVAIRKSFYSDYLYSEHSFGRYFVTTTPLPPGTLVRLQGPAFSDDESAVLLDDFKPGDHRTRVLVEGTHMTILREEIHSVIN